MQVCASRWEMLPGKTRRRSKSGRRRGSKKDDPFGPVGSAPDEAEGVSPTLREKDMESAITMDLGSATSLRGERSGKKQPPPQPPRAAQSALDQPAPILSAKKEKKRRRRRRKESASEVDEGNDATVASIPPEASNSGIAQGTSSAGALPKQQGANGTEKVSPRTAVRAPRPVLQGATTGTGSLAGSNQRAALSPRPPAVAMSSTTSTAAPTVLYLPGPGPVADFGKAAPAGSEGQATTTSIANIAASVPSLIPQAQDIPQKIEDACAALRELAKQQRELSSMDPSTSTGGGTHHMPARQSGAVKQQSSSLARTAARSAQKHNINMIQDDEEESASEDEEESLLSSTRKLDRRASKMRLKDQGAQLNRLVAQPRETPANAQEQLNLKTGSRTVPADSVVLTPDVANKLVSVLTRVENLASGIASQSGRESGKSRNTGSAAAARANLCAKCRVTEKKRDSVVDTDQLSDDGSDEEEADAPEKRHEHKRKQHRPARTKGRKYNAPEELDQNDWDYDESLYWDDERENRREDAELVRMPRRRSRSYSSLETDREAPMSEQAGRGGAMYEWTDPTDDDRNASYIYRESPPFMRNQRYLPPYCYGGPRLEYRSYGPILMPPPYLLRNPMLFLNSSRAPLVPLANQVPYQGSHAALPPSNLELLAQGQGYPQGSPFLHRTPFDSYRYPQVSQQNGGSREAGGQMLSNQPYANQPVYSTGAPYGQQSSQAYNYSQPSQSIMPTSIGHANSTRPYYPSPHTPETARNGGPEPAIAALTNRAAAPIQRNMTFEAMDASTRYGGSAFNLAVKPKQANEPLPAGTPVETGMARAAPLQGQQIASREERPIPAKKVIAWTMNKTAPTRASRPTSSSGPSHRTVPSTSGAMGSETAIACRCKCHSCASEDHYHPDDQRDASLEKILRHDGDMRWDEQLCERSRLLREDRIRQEERFQMRQRLQDQERLFREELQFQADLERRREADKALLQALEKESKAEAAEARATAAIMQALAGVRAQEVARSSASAGQDSQAAVNQAADTPPSEDDAVFASTSSTLDKPASKAGSERRCSDAGIQVPHMPTQLSCPPSTKASLEPMAAATGSTSTREISTNTVSPSDKVSSNELEKLDNTES